MILAAILPQICIGVKKLAECGIVFEIGILRGKQERPSGEKLYSHTVTGPFLGYQQSAFSSEQGES